MWTWITSLDFHCNSLLVERNTHQNAHWIFPPWTHISLYSHSFPPSTHKYGNTSWGLKANLFGPYLYHFFLHYIPQTHGKETRNTHLMLLPHIDPTKLCPILQEIVLLTRFNKPLISLYKTNDSFTKCS